MGRYKTTGTRKRKRPKGAPTHVATVPLDPSPAELALALTRNRAGLRLYNAALGEAKKRSRAVKADPAWEKARRMERGKAGSPERVRRSQGFGAVREAHGFTRTALLSYGSSLRRSYIREQVFAQEAQELSARAFDATWMWHLGRRGEPRFKRVRDGLHSLSCKDLCGSMRPVMEDGKITALQWGRATQIPASKPKTRDEQIERERIEALVAAGKLCYCRVVFEKVRGRVLPYLPRVLDGPPPLRHEVGRGKVSFDMGPSTVHVVSEHAAFHEVLAPSVEDKAKELRRNLRHLDRQHRDGSPECFNADGTHIAGRCHWKKRSKAAEATKKRVAETYRTMAEGRDRD
ncbi:MAG: transposase, partial [Acidimicrobiales bacterium]